MTPNLTTRPLGKPWGFLYVCLDANLNNKDNNHVNVSIIDKDAELNDGIPFNPTPDGLLRPFSVAIEPRGRGQLPHRNHDRGLPTAMDVQRLPALYDINTKLPANRPNEPHTVNKYSYRLVQKWSPTAQQSASKRKAPDPTALGKGALQDSQRPPSVFKLHGPEL